MKRHAVYLLPAGIGTTVSVSVIVDCVGYQPVHKGIEPDLRRRNDLLCKIGVVDAVIRAMDGHRCNTAVCTALGKVKEEKGAQKIIQNSSSYIRGIGKYSNPVQRSFLFVS